MSKGSQIVPVRIPPDKLTEIDEAIERGNHYRADEPWTRTSFIRAAIDEKLAHMARSRAPKRASKKGEGE